MEDCKLPSTQPLRISYWILFGLLLLQLFLGWVVDGTVRRIHILALVHQAPSPDLPLDPAR